MEAVPWKLALQGAAIASLPVGGNDEQGGFSQRCYLTRVPIGAATC